MKQLVIAIMLVLPMMCAAQEAVKLEAEAEKKEAKLEAMAAKFEAEMERKEAQLEIQAAQLEAEMEKKEAALETEAAKFEADMERREALMEAEADKLEVAQEKNDMEGVKQHKAEMQRLQQEMRKDTERFKVKMQEKAEQLRNCLLYTSPSPRD